MSCDAIIQQLTSEAGRISTDIYNRQWGRSPWMSLTARGTFPQEMGQTISNLTYERSAPLDAEPTWTSMNFSETEPVEGGICLPSATKVPIGSTLRNFSLARRVLEGPDFCAEQLRTPLAVAKQLNAIVDVLAGYSIIEWEIRDRHEYFRMCKRKVVVDGCPPTSTFTQAAAYPAVCATSVLTQGILNQLKMKLMRDGAGQSAMGMNDGEPILTLVCSPETSDNLIFLNPDIRQDIRWGKPSELLAPFGAVRDYRGFYHLKDMYARRFSCSGGVYTEIATFSSAAATKGTKDEINPSYESAQYEESFIYDRTVFNQLIPEPITSPGANITFDPVNYTGDWVYLNIRDRICNPRGTIGFHQGILAAASEPVHPERGVAIVHRRCDPACNLVTSCTT